MSEARNVGVSQDESCSKFGARTHQFAERISRSTLKEQSSSTPSSRHRVASSSRQTHVYAQCTKQSDAPSAFARMSTLNPGKPDYTVGGKYRLIRKIGSGSFGDIYLGINITNGEVSHSILQVCNSTRAYGHLGEVVCV